MCFILNYMMNSCWNCLLATEVYFGLYEVLQLTEEPPTPPPAALWEYYESIRQRGSAGGWKRPEKNGNGEVVSKRGQNNISIIAVFVQTFLLVMTTGVKWVVNAAGSSGLGGLSIHILMVTLDVCYVTILMNTQFNSYLCR